METGGKVNIPKALLQQASLLSEDEKKLISLLKRADEEGLLIGKHPSQQAVGHYP